MPTVCAPWPGKRKAIFVNVVSRLRAAADTGGSAVEQAQLRTHLGPQQEPYPASGRLFFGLDHRAAAVVTAIRTDRVRGNRRAALGAVFELLGANGVVSPATAGSGVRVFPLGNSHDYTWAGAANRTPKKPVVKTLPLGTCDLDSGLPLGRDNPASVHPTRQETTHPKNAPKGCQGGGLRPDPDLPASEPSGRGTASDSCHATIRTQTARTLSEASTGNWTQINRMNADTHE